MQRIQIPFLNHWITNTVTQLPIHYFTQLLDLFRNPLQAIDPQHKSHLGEDLFNAKKHREEFLAYTYYDYEIKQLVKQGDKTRPEFFLSHKEPLAKTLAYAQTNTVEVGMIAPIYNQNTKQLDYYQLQNKVCGPGLYSYLLVPLDSTSNLPAQLIFRGTNCAESLQRDAEYEGVGKKSFDKCAPKIQAMLATYANTTKKAKLEIIGHSLGGTDAQRTLINLVDPENDFHFSEIALFSYSSPKLDFNSLSLS